jgi:hypothetical protein
MQLVNIHERTNKKRDVPNPGTQVWFSVKCVIKFPIFLHFMDRPSETPLILLIANYMSLSSLLFWLLDTAYSPHGCHCGQTWSKESTCKHVYVHLIYKRLLEAFSSLCQSEHNISCCRCQGYSCLKSIFALSWFPWVIALLLEACKVADKGCHHQELITIEKCGCLLDKLN